MSENVFAYGSNMCSGRFRDYGVVPEEIGCSVLLQNYHLRFNKRSRRDGSGKANAEPNNGGQVWGVLYTIPDAHLEILDQGEGGYHREKLQVTTENTVINAWVYLAGRASNDPTLRPYTWYKRFLIEGAKEHDLPSEYIETLEGIEAIPDPDEHRDREKRALK